MSVFFFSVFMLVVPVSRQANPAHPEYPMGCQTQLCQYQTDRDDVLLGHDGEIFRGVWVVVLPALNLD